MKKIEKWLVCSNDRVAEPTTYLLHTREPRFLIEVKNLDLATSPDPNAITESIVYINPDSLPELYELEVIHIYSDNPAREAVAKNLKLAAKWYKEFLFWDDGEQGATIPDFNARTPGLKIIYSGYARKWLTIYKGKIETFDIEPEMDEYLYSLGFTDDDLDEGFITHIK